MSGIAIRIDDADLRRAGHALDALVRDADRAHDLMDEIGAALVTSVQQRFQAGRSPDGDRWTPSRRAARTGGQTLVDRGHLRDSITHAADSRSARVGTNLIYARIHQLGGQIRARAGGALAIPLPDGGVALRKSVTLPARPYLGISADDREEIGDIIRERLRDALRRGEAGA
ncbi:phage virion morphogenesis protein [Roseospira navarrensis]|uniref:Phage virion morphogenesis protein n=1 Tax=Roseospira navarrensis TaxID=140058 RepID=A0A7X1ZE46_9PROT|nr:phage virion morphogenesis protein [Roseospira navarrensis]MQX36821.1 phage virion morphogenesis protein [Roseospira navarrensis]